MSIQLIVIQVITFIAVIFILRMLFYSQLNSALARLNKLHEENLIKEEELKKQLEEAKLERANFIEKAKAEAAAIVKDAKVRAENAASELATKSKGEMEKKFEHVKEEVEKMKVEAEASSNEKASGLALKMLEAVFTDAGRSALQHELISEILEEIKGLEKGKFTVKTKEVDIVTASPLVSEDKTQLAKILSEKIGSRVDVKESVDKGIIAGLVIKIGALTIDGSIRNKLRKIKV